jgi:hypothetical protein
VRDEGPVQLACGALMPAELHISFASLKEDNAGGVTSVTTLSLPARKIPDYSKNHVVA